MKFKLKISHIVLIVLFLLSLELRLFYTFQTPYYSSDEAYSSIREIESIQNTGLPITEDTLRPQNAFMMNPPLFHYIMAFFNLFLPLDMAGKLIPSIFSSLIIFAVYLIAMQLTDGNESASLFSALLSSFIPVLFVNVSVNTISPYSLVIPVIFFMLYCFMRIRSEKYLYMYLLLLVALPFIHPSSIILIPVFLFYMLLVKMEKIRQLRAEFELILFSALYLIWVLFLFYKNAFLIYGPHIIWQNIPEVILNNYFSETNILKALYNIGLLPVIFGIYVVYKSIFIEKNTRMYLFISFGITVSILLYLRLIQLELGLVFLGVTLAILFARFYDALFNYIEKTSVSQFYGVAVAILFLVFCITSLYPSLVYAQQTVDRAVTEDEIISLLWMSDNLKHNATVLALPAEGNLVTSLAQRRIIMDSQYLLIPDINERIEDVDRIYATQYVTEALELLTKYDIDYIYFSQNAAQKYGIDEPRFIAGNENCFELIYDFTSKIYASKCVIGD